MTTYLKLFRMFSVCLIMCTLIGCGMVGSGPTETYEPYLHDYDPDDPTEPLSYLDAAGVGISLHVWDESSEGNGAFRKTVEGEYMPPNTSVRLGVIVNPSRTFEDLPMSYGVYLSDGSGDFHVQALPDENGEYYICNYDKFNDKYLVYPLLITVLYSDMKTAKKKVMFDVHEGLGAESGKLVEKGLGIVLSKGIMNSLKDGFSALAPENMTIADFRPATAGDAIFHLDFDNGLGADLSLNDTYTDGEGNSARGLQINLGLTGGDDPGIIGFLMNLFLGIAGPVLDMTGLTKMAMGPVSLDLADQLSGLSGGGDSEDGGMMAGLMENIQLDTLLFLNIKGLPEETNSDFAAIRAGIFPADVNLLSKVTVNSEDKYMWPEVEIDNTDTGIDLNKIKTGNTDIGVVLSQYNLNQMLEGIMQGFSVKAEGEMVAPLTGMVPTDSPSNILSVLLTINPKGIAMKMRGADNKISMNVYDLHMEVLQDDIPVTLISIDLALEMTPSVRSENGELFLDLAVDYLPELSQGAVIKDGKGMGVADKSGFVNFLWKMTTGGEGTFVQSIPLSSMGLIPKGDTPGSVEIDENGNCYLSLALDSMDASTSGLCFISTANF